MPKKRRLLMITVSHARGGAEECLLMIARHAAGDGWEVHLGIERGAGTAGLWDDFLKGGMTCHDARISDRSCGVPSKSGILRQCFAIIPVLIRVRPAAIVINMHGWSTGIGVLTACAVLNMPALVIFHLFPQRFQFSRIKKRVYQWCMTRHQKWVSVSENNRQFISETIGIDRDAIGVIYNGVKEADLLDVESCRRDVRKELSLREDEYLILTVARLDGLKGHEDVIPVARELIRTNERIRFVWVGEGDYRQTLEEKVRLYGLEDRILFLDHRPDIYRLMKSADLFLFPSHYEGLSLALLEAMTCAMPIVSSDANSASELIQDGVHGRIFRVGDCPSMLAHIQAAISNPDTTKKMAQNARLRSLNFSQDRCAKKTLELIATLQASASGTVC